MKKYAGLLLALVMLAVFIVPVSAQPGSADDPLVSKKYVDDQLNSLKVLIDSRFGTTGTPTQTVIPDTVRDEFLAEALSAFETVYGGMLRQAAVNAETPAANLPPATTVSAPVFEVVFAEKGKVIYCDSSTELILRGGAATAISGVNGLSDVTGGTDITNGKNIPYNHLLIVPVGDGRGIRITTDAYLMIKGGYYFG